VILIALIFIPEKDKIECAPLARFSKPRPLLAQVFQIVSSSLSEAETWTGKAQNELAKK
jgi:hypothetical protein